MELFFAGVNEACFQVTVLDETNERVQLIPFIFDFVQKVIALKVGLYHIHHKITIIAKRFYLFPYSGNFLDLFIYFYVKSIFA